VRQFGGPPSFFLTTHRQRSSFHTRMHARTEHTSMWRQRRQLSEGAAAPEEGVERCRLRDHIRSRVAGRAEGCREGSPTCPSTHAQPPPPDNRGARGPQIVGDTALRLRSCLHKGHSGSVIAQCLRSGGVGAKQHCRMSHLASGATRIGRERLVSSVLRSRYMQDNR
jgi:hypothetical protein